MPVTLTKVPTQKQLAVYEMIKARIIESGEAPSYQEIAKAMGWGRARAAQHHVEKLVECGLLTHEQGKHRSIRVVELEAVEAEVARIRRELMRHGTPAPNTIKKEASHG